MTEDLELSVDVQDDRWTEALKDAALLAERAVLAAFAAVPDFLETGQSAEASLVFASDAFVQDLNKTYRGQDKPTNVLSFAALDDADDFQPEGEPLQLGDIVIAFETCVAEAERDNKSLSDHLSHLAVHGMLHLLGFDHMEDEDAHEMEALETKILGTLNIEDPYKE